MESALVFDREGLEPCKVIQSIHRNGVALIRNALPAAAIAGYKNMLEEYFCALEQHDDEKALEYKKVNGLAGPHVPQLLIDILHATSNSCIMDCIDVYFEKRDVVVPWNHFLFRKRDLKLEQSFVDQGYAHGFHQDRVVIPSAFSFNVWLPLVKIDDDCPGLSFVFPYSEQIFPLPFDLEGYIARNDGHVWSPSLAPGDCLLFHWPTIHGAFCISNRKNTRYSAEFRCGALVDTPDEYRSDIVPLGRGVSLS